jgi:hypothetical protein
MSSSVDLGATRSGSHRPLITTHVPGIGQVEWSQTQLTAHAGLLNRTHVPDHTPTGFGSRWFRLPVSRPHRQPACCASCALDWPCPELRWATSWLSTKQRLLRALTHQPRK